MKKIILLLTIILFITFNLISFKIFSLQKENSILYKNNTEISIVYNNNTTTTINDFIEELKTQSKNLKVNVSQYVFLDDTTLNIYSSNIKCDSNIKLVQGDLPKENSNEYISNSILNKVDNNVGKLKFPKSDLKIKCYNFDQIRNVGIGNKFIISTDNRDSIPKIVELFQKYGKIGSLQIPYQNNMNINIGFMPSLLTILIVSNLLVILFVIYYIIREKFKFALQNLFGYTITSIYTNTLNPILLIFFIGGFITNSILALYFYISSKSDYIFEFYFQSNIFLLITIITLAIFIVLCITFINKNINILLILKGKNLTTSLNITVLISKIVISLIMCFIAGALFNQYNDTQQKLDSIKYWDKTKNIYATQISNQGQADNLALGRQCNDKLYSLYKELRDNKNAFIINSTNYSILEKNGDKITYLYNKNINLGSAEYSPGGKSIVIDEGYLRINPIKLSNNKTLKDSLNPKDNVLNILVPEKYKSIESNIYNSYLDYFYFAKVTVDNIYNKALNLPLNNTSKTSLHVNIIYVKNNQKYFTYSSFTGSEKDHHYIIDPISVIYDGKIDSSFIGSYATQNLYFFDESGGSAYKNISQYLKYTQTGMLVPSVRSVYKDVNQGINNLKVKNKNLLFVLIALASIAVVFSINYMRLYYLNNSYKIYLKTIFGNSFISIHFTIMYVILSINMISSILASIYFKNVLVIFIGLLFIVLELIIAIFSTYYLSRQNIHKIIKGEK